MRGARPVIVCLLAALAVSGCIGRTAPVAMAPQASLDTIAYGQASAPMAMADAGSVRYDSAYHLDASGKLRVVAYGPEGLTNTYEIDAGGTITMPLIGPVPARGRTPAGLAAQINGRLRNGFIRGSSVAVEIESYHPSFILGEVAAPGQYPYVPNLTLESAVAIAGGFSPRAKGDSVTLTHSDASGTGRFVVPPGTPIGPGDTVFVGERWS